MKYQLPLAIQLNAELTLSDFFWGQNVILQQQIETMLQGDGERFFYVWGQRGSGKSHLLQACCHAIQTPKSAIYLPLQLLHAFGPDVLQGIEWQDVLCIDDIHLIAGDPAWEEALFHLYNKARDNQKTTIIMSGIHAPHWLTLQLPDLKSRLAWGLVFYLHELDDESKIHILIDQAQKRGFNLPQHVGQFILNHYGRQMHELHALMEKLDQASLTAQRKITIPFVKEILNDMLI